MTKCQCAECESRRDDAKDAARYRFLKARTRVFSLDMGSQHTYVMDYSIARLRGPSLDAAIDAAIEKASNQPSQQ
jgi:hypothetical protein